MKGKVLMFYLCGHLLGIDITLVKEINRNIDYTPVPGAPPQIVGLLNLRGQVVTLFSLAKLMEYEKDDGQARVACIILKAKPNDPNYVGFLIDKPEDVLVVDEEMCEQPPANVGGIEGRYLSDLVKLKNELLMIINPEILFDN